MIRKSILVLLLVASNSYATGATFLAGSDDESPPPFWENSFWGITRSIERAFPVTLSRSGLFEIEELQVAVYHNDNFSGAQAWFDVCEDTGGLPGNTLGSFFTSGITTEQRVVSAGVATSPLELEGGETYWLVGRTDSGQVNWNLGADAFGPGAFRVSEGPWETFEARNISAFALLGTSAVPEPATGLSILLGTADFACRRPRRGSGDRG